MNGSWKRTMAILFTGAVLAAVQAGSAEEIDMAEEYGEPIVETQGEEATPEVWVEEIPAAEPESLPDESVEEIASAVEYSEETAAPEEEAWEAMEEIPAAAVEEVPAAFVEETPAAEEPIDQVMEAPAEEYIEPAAAPVEEMAEQVNEAPVEAYEETEASGAEEMVPELTEEFMESVEETLELLPENDEETGTTEYIPFDACVAIEQKSGGQLYYGDSLKLKAQVSYANKDYVVTWESLDPREPADNQTWVWFASGEEVTLTITEDYAALLYRVCLTAEEERISSDIWQMPAPQERVEEVFPAEEEIPVAEEMITEEDDMAEEEAAEAEVSTAEVHAEMETSGEQPMEELRAEEEMAADKSKEATESEQISEDQTTEHLGNVDSAEETVAQEEKEIFENPDVDTGAEENGKPDQIKITMTAGENVKLGDTIHFHADYATESEEFRIVWEYSRDGINWISLGLTGEDVDIDMTEELSGSQVRATLLTGDQVQ